MSDDTPTSEPTEGKDGAWKAPADQAELDKIVESRLARERAKFADYDDVKAKAGEFDKAKEASKTAVEKAIERATKAEADALAARLEADRNSVALTKGLTPTQAKRLVGTTRDELEADADELLKDLQVDGKKAPRAPDQKRSETTPKDDPLRDFSQRLFRKAD